jgi:hypothetical protein
LPHAEASRRERAPQLSAGIRGPALFYGVERFVLPVRIMASLIYEVVPVDGVWVVRLKGDSQTEVLGEKAVAVARARALAASRTDGAVRVFTPSGDVEAEYAVTAAGNGPRAK